VQQEAMLNILRTNDPSQDGFVLSGDQSTLHGCRDARHGVPVYAGFPNRISSRRSQVVLDTATHFLQLLGKLVVVGGYDFGVLQSKVVELIHQLGNGVGFGAGVL
jgi:hypothetical protein